jgi:prepilin-type N-terminal cleavage/methylation domain-containing protein
MTLLNQRGFTLTELLVAMAMLGMVLSGIYTLQQQGLYSYMMGSAKVEAQQNARVALDLMIRELRSATSVTAIAVGDLTFVDQNGVTIRYNLTGTNLQRTANAVVDVLIGGVQNMSLTYRDSNGVVTATPASVANVAITITTQPQAANPCAASALNQKMIVQDQVRLRNML